MMPDDGELVAGEATSGMDRLLFVGSSLDETPQALAELDLGDKSDVVGLILAVNTACIILIVVFVAVRLLVRRLMTRQFFLDDALISVAAFFTLALCTVCLLALPHGFGRHVWNLNLATAYDDVRDTVQLMFMANIFYACAITFTKLSIIVSYLRIFPYSTMRIAMHITAAITLGLFVASIPATIFQCNPVSAAWEFGTEHGHATCFAFVNFLYATTAINVTTDLVLCTAPLPYFWNLQLARRQKAIVSFLFLMGGFACVASILRLRVLHLLGSSIDVTYNLAPSVLWTVAECAIGICCVSVPAMRPLFGRLLPDVFVSRRGGAGGGGGYGTSAATRAAARATAARRGAYAMAGLGHDDDDAASAAAREETKTPATPSSVERQTGASSQTQLTSGGGGERVSREWFATMEYDDDRESLSARGSAGYTVTTFEEGGGVEKPKEVFRKG